MLLKAIVQVGIAVARINYPAQKSDTVTTTLYHPLIYKTPEKRLYF